MSLALIDTVPTAPVVALIAFGGNLGECHEAFVAARKNIDLGGVTVIASSPLYRTEPIGGPKGQPDYLNSVIHVETTLSPLQLLNRCHELERQAGRQRLEHWGARTLDLDLLIYGQLVCSTPGLILPHPRLHQRRFVLAPLCALVPAWQHPVLHKTFAELLAALPSDVVDGAVQCVESTW